MTFQKFYNETLDLRDQKREDSMFGLYRVNRKESVQQWGFFGCDEIKGFDMSGMRILGSVLSLIIDVALI